MNNYFLITDVDGTLLDDNHNISAQNLAAISAFVEAGGMFTLATGRGFDMALPIVNELRLKLPVVVLNGAAIYDFSAGKYLWQSEIAEPCRDYIHKICAAFPTAAVEVLTPDGVFVPRLNDLERHHMSLGGVNAHYCDLATLPDRCWFKSLVVDEPTTIDKIIDFVRENGFSGTHWVRSSPTYYEMLPQSANKGAAMRRLIKLLGAENRTAVAAGDFHNDIEMIKYADIGMATANAEPEVKAVADVLLPGNNDNAIHAAVEYLKTIQN